MGIKKSNEKVSEKLLLQLSKYNLRNPKNKVNRILLFENRKIKEVDIKKD